MVSVRVNTFDCHWGLPGDYRDSKNSVIKSIDEVVELCKALKSDSWIYLYFPDTDNRICVQAAEGNLVNVDLQYSDPYCDGDISIADLRALLSDYENFQKQPEKYGLEFDES